jgi:hypothetical protein
MHRIAEESAEPVEVISLELDRVTVESPAGAALVLQLREQRGKVILPG